MHSKNAFLIRFYCYFFVIVGIMMVPCNVLDKNVVPWTRGTASLVCVVGWNIAFVLLVPKKSTLRTQWEFCALLSLIMPIPDLFLVKVLGTLVFDPHPFRIGDGVPVAMMGMWTIALLPVIHLANMYGTSRTSRNVLGGLISGMWFFLAELFCAPFLRLWHVTPKVQLLVGHIPLYVIVAEAILGATVVHIYNMEHDSRLRPKGNIISHLCGAAGVMLIYTGSLAATWLVLEVGIL